MKKRSSKGFTLIELLIVTAIMLMVFTGVYTFFFSSYKANIAVNDELELQSQGEKAISFIADNVMDAYGINSVSDISGNDVLNSTSSTVIKAFSVKRKENGGDTVYLSQFELKDGQLNYTKNGEVKEISNLIESIVLTPMPGRTPFEDSKGIIITVNLKQKDKTKSLSNEVFFRNKK